MVAKITWWYIGNSSKNSVREGIPGIHRQLYVPILVFLPCRPILVTTSYTGFCNCIFLSICFLPRPWQMKFYQRVRILQNNPPKHHHLIVKAGKFKFMKVCQIYKFYSGHKTGSLAVGEFESSLWPSSSFRPFRRMISKSSSSPLCSSWCHLIGSGVILLPFSCKAVCLPPQILYLYNLLVRVGPERGNPDSGPH